MVRLRWWMLFASVAIPVTANAAPTVLDVAQRAVAQEGLAIAAASNVLQTQVRVLLDIEGADSSACVSLGTNGSMKRPVADEYVFYYDTACTRKFIDATESTPNSSANPVVISGTATYFGPSGTNLGTLTLNESALFVPNFATATKIEVSGLGTFQAASGAVPVDLGLTCTVGTASTVPCAGGIAQDFAKLGEALASVSPLTLKAAKTGTRITFTGANSQLVTGALGHLSVTTPTQTTLGIGGTHASWGTTTAKGGAAEFALFPPTPTGWTVTDKAHGVVFAVKVLTNGSFDSAGTVKTTGKSPKTLATFTVDQSGTGSISWSDGTKDAITAWTLAD